MTFDSTTSSSAGTVDRRAMRCDFETYFSNDSILRELAKHRVRLADTRNRSLFIHRISKQAISRAAQTGSDRDRLGKMFPPRREWHACRARRANRDGRPAADLNLDALIAAVSRSRRKSPNSPWVQCLDAEIAAIRTIGLTVERSVPVIQVKAIKKDYKGTAYRPLAMLRLRDKIVEALTARYLRNILEPYLRPSCMAFRCGSLEGGPPTIHDALDRILQARVSFPNERWVAECDIRGFFDCVTHEVAESALRSLVEEVAAKEPSIKIDERAMCGLQAFFASYSFEDNVKSPQTPLLPVGSGAISWPHDELVKLHGVGGLPRIGVPQGGAFSCLIANVMLHETDKKLEQLQAMTGAYTYMRYCDDMVIIAGDRHTCESAFALYLKCLRDLRLPVHEPTVPMAYRGKDKAAFWSAKSKRPYRWGTPTGGDAYPWIQFLGYQIKYDGSVRVRPKSLQKHRRKILESANAILKLLGTPKSIRKKTNQINFRLSQRFLSFSVGRRKISAPFEGPARMCWAFGFRGLTKKQFVRSSLKSLDWYREKQLKRVAKRLFQLKIKANAPRKRSMRVPRFNGHPLSYYGQFSAPKLYARSRGAAGAD